MGDESIFTDIDTLAKTQVKLGNNALVDVKEKGIIAVETNKGSKYIHQNIFMMYI